MSCFKLTPPPSHSLHLLHPCDTSHYDLPLPHTPPPRAHPKSLENAKSKNRRGTALLKQDYHVMKKEEVEEAEDEERRRREDEEDEEEEDRRKAERSEKRKKERLAKMMVNGKIVENAGKLCTNCDDQCDGFIPNKFSPLICEDCECARKFHTNDQDE